jgi:DNA-binding response OmpR family regulator
MKLLLADDEKQLTDALFVILKQNNYAVDVVHNGEDAFDYAQTGVYDLIILDVMMPKMDGFTVLKKLRTRNINTPVLVLSAKSEVDDKVNGLNLGADDYLTKPFEKNEFLARIKALLRRKEKFTGDILSFGDLVLSRDTLELSRDDKKITLGKKEFQILEMLILSEGKLVNKDKMMEKIWGWDSEAEYNTVEVYISFLRKKLLLLNSSVEIKSLRGLGYILEVKND